MTESHHVPRLALLAMSIALAAGCEEDFPAYNELQGFRVLALRASPPALREGERTVLDALVFVEDGDATAVTYRWSYCPLRAPISAGGDCLLDEAEFAALLGVAADDVTFELGSGPTAQLTYPGTAAAYERACANQAGTAQGVVFTCDGGFPLSVRADVTYEGKTIRVQKEVRLVFDDAPPNGNPSLGDLTLWIEDDTEQAWPEDAVPSLPLGGELELRAAVDPSQAEPFTPEPTAVNDAPEERLEALYVTWFVTTGETKYQRTSYLAGELPLDNLEDNRWTLPKAGDEMRREAQLFLVLRDERGGVDWLARRAELAP